MNTGLRKEQIIAAAATALLFISLIATGYYYSSNNTLKLGLNKEKLTSESLLSEKLALIKETERLKADITSWIGKNEKTDKLLADAKTQVEGMENTIKGLRRETASIPALRREIRELGQLRQTLENQIAQLEQTNRNNERRINDMANELTALKSDLAFARSQVVPVNITDGFRVESFRGRKNNRLTANANRTKKLVVSFEIPQTMAENIKFNIVTPDGKEVTSESADLSYEIIDDGRYLTASLSPITGNFEISRRIEMTYSPKQKLSSGNYKIEILHNEKVAGSCQVRLR
jgi:hypothetical protein